MGQMKLLQFMVVCIYAHNNYSELISTPVEEKDSMPIKVELGKKRVHAEPMEIEQPHNERQMNPYSVLVQSTTVNVKFVLRSEGKFKAKDGKSTVYKYCGSIHRKGGEVEKFSQKTLAELREMTGLSFASLATKKTPAFGETLCTNDVLESKLTTLTGDIDAMLKEFVGEMVTKIDKVNDNVLIVNENLVNGLGCLRDNQRLIINKLDQLKEGTVADSMSFCADSTDEVLKLRAELEQKNKIIRQKDELIVLLMKQLEERK